MQVRGKGDARLRRVRAADAMPAGAVDVRLAVGAVDAHLPPRRVLIGYSQGTDNVLTAYSQGNHRVLLAVGAVDAHLPRRRHALGVGSMGH